MHQIVIIRYMLQKIENMAIIWFLSLPTSYSSNGTFIPPNNEVEGTKDTRYMYDLSTKNDMHNTNYLFNHTEQSLMKMGISSQLQSSTLACGLRCHFHHVISCCIKRTSASMFIQDQGLDFTLRYQKYSFRLRAKLKKSGS